MAKNNGNKKKKSNLYYAVIALLLIISGALGTSQQDGNVADNNTDVIVESQVDDEVSEEIHYTFRKKSNLESHYEKHGIEMGFENAEEYLAAANKVLINPDTLHKIEKEDGDDVYYLEETNEFVVVSTDGYIRTYFNPSGGIDYFNRQ